MNDLSGSVNLLESAQYAAGKNKIINGDFGVWQRGTTFTNPATSAYTADRMRLGQDGTGGTLTVSQQSFTPGTAPVAGYESSYFYRYAWSVAQTTATVNTVIGQNIEDVRTFAGQTITISFYAKADTTRTITPQILQRFGSGGSTTVTALGTALNITTSWARYSSTFSVPSISGKTIGTANSFGINLNSGTLNAIYTFDIWGVQVEAGSVASEFQTATGTLQGELAACQRYYFRSTATTNFSYYPVVGNASSTTNVGALVIPPVTMRTSPSSIDFSNVAVTDAVTNTTVTGITLNQANPMSTNINIAVASGLTQFRPYRLLSDNNSAAFFGMNAEL
jgi:hypothetical protein